MNICFISCVKQKSDKPGKARDLYTSSLFKKSLAYAEKNFDKVYILSAKYQLVGLDDVIAPYNMTLNKMPTKAKQAWALHTASKIKPLLKPEDKLFFIAGENYHKYLIPLLPNESTVLFEGLGLGKRLQAMT